MNKGYLNEYEARRRAREDIAKHAYEHEKKMGRDPSFESVKRHTDERADIQDKRKDRNIRD